MNRPRRDRLGALRQHGTHERDHSQQRRADASARPGGVADDRRRGREGRDDRHRIRLPQHRHRHAVRQRGGCRPRPARLGRPSRGAVRHHQAVERPAGLRRGAARLRREHAAARPGDPRSLPDPLARAPARQVRRDVEGPGEAVRRRTGAGDRGVQLRGGHAGAPARRGHGDPRREPGRAAPAVRPAGAARLPRRTRHRHRGVEPARPGEGPARSARPRRDRREVWQDAGCRWCCAGTSSSATW